MRSKFDAKITCLLLIIFLWVPSWSQETPASQEQDNTAYGTALALSPYLRRNTVVKYRDGSESSYGQHTTFGVGISFFGKPKGLYGVRGSMGIDLESNRGILFRNSYGQQERFDAVASAAYVAVGFQFWKLYGEGGIHFPLEFDKDWGGYNMEAVPGARFNVGLEIKKGLSLEAFWRFHSYSLREKFSLISNPETQIFHHASGVVLKFSGF